MKRNNTALSYSLYLLSRRDYATSEISEKLNKRYTEEESKKCIEFLKEKKFLDDARFAKGFVRSASSKGKTFIKMKLTLLKIDPNIIENELSVISEEDEIEKAKDLVTRYISKKGKTDNLYQKAGGYLLRRGFNYDITKKVLYKVLNENQ